jgi:hypothetical protein
MKPEVKGSRAILALIKWGSGGATTTPSEEGEGGRLLPTERPSSSLSLPSEKMSVREIKDMGKRMRWRLLLVLLIFLVSVGGVEATINVTEILGFFEIKKILLS